METERMRASAWKVATPPHRSNICPLVKEPTPTPNPNPKQETTP